MQMLTAQRKIKTATGITLSPFKGDTPLWRVLHRFEPAFAGGALPLGSTLAVAYRVPQ